MDKKKKKQQNLTGMIMGGVFGALVGFIMVKYIGGSGEDDKKTKLITIGVILVSVFASYFLGLIIHEGGHLVMGLLTGYRFVSFRIGSIVIIRKNGKFKIGKYSIPGTAGQCLMTHDIVDEPEKVPYFWYHAGGGLFNLLTAAICGSVLLIVSSKYAAHFFGILAAVSLFMAFSNLIPMQVGGVPNDGANILAQYRSAEERKYLLNTLIINGENYQGKTLDEIPDKLFEGADPAGEIGKVQLAMVEASRYFERFDFTAASKIYESVLSNEKIPSLFINECKCELMFCYIMTGESDSKIDELYDNDLKKYIHITEKFMITRPRLMYAYYYIYKKDNAQADKYYNLIQTMAKDYICEGECRQELKVTEYIKENY